jgi:hypothetical protein
MNEEVWYKDHESDLKRADDAESQVFDPSAMIDAAEESIDSSW